MEVKNKIIEAQRKIIDALAGCENNIGLLYEKYASRFPEMKQQWSSLSKAEKMHANLLKTMHRILDKGSVFYNLGKFSDVAIQPMITIINSALKEADAPDLTSDDAITAALKIESSIMDAHFYDIVASDAPEFRIIAERLSGETKQHAELIRKHFEQNIRKIPNGKPD